MVSLAEGIYHHHHQPLQKKYENFSNLDKKKFI